jgi:hypothetical protein
VQIRQEKTQAADHENLHSDSKSERQKAKHREKKATKRYSQPVVKWREINYRMTEKEQTEENGKM